MWRHLLNNTEIIEHSLSYATASYLPMSEKSRLPFTPSSMLQSKCAYAKSYEIIQKLQSKNLLIFYDFRNENENIIHYLNKFSIHEM